MTIGIRRRDLLRALPAVSLLPAALAQGQTSRPTIRVRALNHMTLTVSDPKRSLEFYQGLFGMPIQARQGPTTLLRVGRGPQFVALTPAGAGVRPHINHFCLTVDDFQVDRLRAVLGQHGVSEATAAMSAGGLSGGALRVRVRMRGPEAGGAKEGTPEVYIGDPGGAVLQLQDPRYCGGAGAYGEACGAPEPAPSRGRLTLGDYNHFTLRSPDPDRAVAFYRSIFGLPIQVYQGKTPALGIGGGPQFLMMSAAGAGANTTAPTAVAYIHHACLTVDGFNVERIFKVLSDYGLKPRGNAEGDPPPLTYYVVMRMPDRGGAPGGTPELYFSDPDGLLIQLQDHTYCGGAGVLGERCS